MSYHEQPFNSTLFGTSIYRQEPSPEVDQAWIDLGVYCKSDIFDLCSFDKMGNSFFALSQCGQSNWYSGRSIGK
jgi:hypothetical protein